MPENRKPQHRLDPRQPLVLDTRELGRRPGSMRTVRFPAPAPDALGVELIGVPPGSEIDLDLRLGEGTGAALAFPVVEAAGALLREMATFDSAGVARKDTR